MRRLAHPFSLLVVFTWATACGGLTSDRKDGGLDGLPSGSGGASAAQGGSGGSAGRATGGVGGTGNGGAGGASATGGALGSGGAFATGGAIGASGSEEWGHFYLGATRRSLIGEITSTRPVMPGPRARQKSLAPVLRTRTF